MTQQQHHAMTNIDSAVPSLARLGSDVKPCPTSTQQRHRKHDSTVTSHHDLHDSAASSPAWLSGDITPWPTLTWQHHHQHVSATSLPAWLSGYITPWPTPTRQCHHQHDLTMTLYHGQHQLGSIVASMTRQWQHTIADIALIASSPTWLGNDITPWPMMSWQCHRQHDSSVTSRHCQHWLSGAVTSMTWGLGTYFLNQQFDLKVHHQSGSGARRVPLQPTTRLGYTATFIASFNSRRARHHQQYYETLHQTS
jgi:hypothetical protein